MKNSNHTPVNLLPLEAAPNQKPKPLPLNRTAKRVAGRSWQEIPLTKGFVAIVDDDDFDEISKHNWHCSINSKVNIYARAIINRQQFKMHHLIIKKRNGLLIDHINGNGLDNRRCNLRLATREQNARNRRLHSNNTSGHKGVSYRKTDKKFSAYIRVNGKRITLGMFKTIRPAIEAYREASKRLHGDFSNLI